MSDTAKIIGERIRIYRTKSGYTQSELAEKAGLHHTYVGQLERGEKNATIDSIERVATALDVSLEVLFERIISGDIHNPIPNTCYELIHGLSEKEQRSMLDILQKIISYKTL